MKYLIYIIPLAFVLSTYAQDKQTACNNSIEGQVLEVKTAKPLSNSRVILRLNNEVLDNKLTDPNGRFSFESSKLECDKRYLVIVTNENHSRDVKLVYTENKNQVHKLKMELVPVKELYVKDSIKYILSNEVTFETNSTKLTSEAKKSLHLVYNVLEKYPYLKIEIGFHSNNLGDFEFLKNLTQKRADSCKDYFVEQGIDSDRVSAVGYGFSKPIDACNNEEMLQQKRRCSSNARIEFKVISD